MYLESPIAGQGPRVIIDQLQVGSQATSRNPATESVSSTDILVQIAAAFQMRPDVANLLQGRRRIYQGGRGRRTALFASTKNGGAISVESRLELAHAVALEGSSSVIRYRTQAVCITLTERHVAYPDFLVEVTGGRFEIHEIKPSIAHLSADETQRFDRIERILRSYGIAFRLIDSNNLASGRALEERLLSYTRGHTEQYTSAQISLALKVLNSGPLGLFSDAYERLENHDLPSCLADYLNFHGQWVCPPRAKIQQSGSPREQTY